MLNYSIRTNTILVIATWRSPSRLVPQRKKKGEKEGEKRGKKNVRAFPPFLGCPIFRRLQSMRNARYHILQSPVQSFRGKNLDIPFWTIPTVFLHEKFSVFENTVLLATRSSEGIVQRGKSRFFPRNDCTGDCSNRYCDFCLPIAQHTSCDQHHERRYECDPHNMMSERRPLHHYYHRICDSSLEVTMRPTSQARAPRSQNCTPFIIIIILCYLVASF
jgi:hypothetical protein